jgi:glyoxylase-like metal-dependent hydrolase (beta-lactamase superfamily II)
VLDPTLFDETVLGPYRTAGYDIPDLLVDAVPPGGLAGAVLEIDAAPATRLVEDGEVIDLGDRAFEVLHLPGHSPGSIGLWDPATGTLFSGDAVYDGPLLDELDAPTRTPTSPPCNACSKLPVVVVHGGHEPSFDKTAHPDLHRPPAPVGGLTAGRRAGVIGRVEQARCSGQLFRPGVQAT